MANSLYLKLMTCPNQGGAICPRHILNSNAELAKECALGHYITVPEYTEFETLLERIKTRLRGGDLSAQLLENI